MNADLHLWLIPIIPFAGFLVNGLAGRKAPKPVVTAVALIGSLLPLLLVSNIVTKFGSLTLPHVERLGTWITAGGFHADFAFQLDQLTLVMLCVVTGVGFLIHVYSVGYMAEEDGYWRFFAYMNLFLFFMLTLVLAENFLLMFVGWEGVGLASYLLIGFYFTRDSAANAGKKAFIVNRIGDFGFLIAMFLLVAHFGSLNFSEVFSQISARPELQGGFLTAIALFLVLGATGKSAQIPLYVWLPDAMEGPTPVSALIHAATMVTAGVYMVARTHVIFDRSPLALTVVATIGVATAFFAATIGILQTDIKRVLAYSTISQLGYMFLGCGVAAYSAGIFHLVTHAFFKALLFLAAGSVIHALSGEQDMRAMGGLRKKIPVTFWTMTAAVLAISGVPPLAGFVSKDEILYQAFISPNGGKIFWAVGLLTAGLTSFYMFRLWYMTFFGERRAAEAAHEEDHGAAVHARSDTKLVVEAEAHAHPVHESPWVMLGPLVVLAILSVVGGFMGWPDGLGGSNWFSHFLEPAVKTVHMSYEQATVVLATGASGAPNTPNASPAGDKQLELMLAAVSTLVAFLGWLLAHILYFAKPELPERLAQNLRALYALVKNKYWVDEIYGAIVVAPVLFVARWVLGVLIDRAVIDGGTLTAGYTAQGFGALVARIQSGNIRSYAGWLALFAAVLLAISYFGFMPHFSLR
ncbi:MAG: NADH-quinone oxidoreductase subunit L [Acidobacteriota bacterium]